MQGAGEIKADDAIAAIKDAMKTSVGGDVEKVLAGKANSLSAIMGQLAASPMTFFSGMEQDPAIADKMKNSLKGLVDLLDPSTAKGKAFATSFAKMIDVVAGPGADMFGKMVDAAPAFMSTLTTIGAAIGPIVSVLGWFAALARGAADALWPWQASAFLAPLAWPGASLIGTILLVQRRRLA